MNPDTLPAVVDCLIPPDDFPGAYDAGVCDYIEQLFQTDLAGHAEFFRAGIETIDSEALATYNAPFAVLTRDQQIAILEGIESGAVKTSWPIAPAPFFAAAGSFFAGVAFAAGAAFSGFGVGAFFAGGSGIADSSCSCSSCFSAAAFFFARVRRMLTGGGGAGGECGSRKARISSSV